MPENTSETSGTGNKARKPNKWRSLIAAIAPSPITLIVLVIYIATSVAITWPLAQRISTEAFYFSGDTGLNAYIIAWAQHAMLNDPLNIFDASFFYPTPNTIAMNDNLFAVAFFGLPLAIFRNPLIVYNVMLMAGMFATAMVWYLALRRWGFMAWAAFLGGFALGFMPWRFGHLGHANLQFTWWLPGVIYFVERWIRLGGWRPALLASACLAGCFYSTVYHTFFTMQFLIPFGLTGLWAYRDVASWRTRMLQALGASVFFVLLLSPALGPYYRTKSDLRNPNRIETLCGMSGELSDYARPIGSNLVWGKFLHPSTRKDAATPWEQANFLGFAVILLGTIGFVIAFMEPKSSEAAVPQSVSPHPQPRRLALMFLSGGLWLFLLSFGPYLHWMGERTEIPMPHMLVFKFFPGAQAVRVPARASFMVGFAFSGMAALAVDRLWRLRASTTLRLASRIFVLAIGLLLTAESFHLQNPVSSSRTYERHLSLQRRIAEERRGPILVLPIELQLNYLIPMATHPHFYPTLNGVTGYLPSSNSHIFDLFNQPQWGEEQREILRALRVRYIVTDPLVHGLPKRASNRMIESFLRDSGFIFERTKFEAEQLTLFKIDPDYEDFEMDVFSERVGKQGRICITLGKIGRVRTLPRAAQRAEVSLRVYDNRDETIWRARGLIILPENWVPGHAVLEIIEIPEETMKSAVEIKLRVRQEYLGYKTETKLRL